MDKDLFQSLLDSCYRYIGHRPRTKKEINDYLMRKIVHRSVEEEEGLIMMNIVIERLIEENLINDLDFISWWIEQRSTFRPRSKKALVYELISKGVQKQDIDSYFEQNKVKEEDQALSLLKQKELMFRKFTGRILKHKAITYLLSRGFSYSSIKIAFEEWIKKE